MARVSSLIPMLAYNDLQVTLRKTHSTESQCMRSTTCRVVGNISSNPVMAVYAELSFKTRHKAAPFVLQVSSALLPPLHLALQPRSRHDPHGPSLLRECRCKERASCLTLAHSIPLLHGSRSCHDLDASKLRMSYDPSEDNSAVEAARKCTKSALVVELLLSSVIANASDDSHSPYSRHSQRVGGS